MRCKRWRKLAKILVWLLLCFLDRNTIPLAYCIVSSLSFHISRLLRLAPRTNATPPRHTTDLRCSTLANCSITHSVPTTASAYPIHKLPYRHRATSAILVGFEPTASVNTL